MDNKNQKTFADLFSSSESNQNDNTITFDDILSKGSSLSESDTSKVNDVAQQHTTETATTFDNLFDKIIEKSDTLVENEITTETNDDKDLKKFPETFDQEFDNKELKKDYSIFDSLHNETESESLDEISKNSQSSTLSSNLFFDLDNQHSEIDERKSQQFNNIFFQSSSVEANNTNVNKNSFKRNDDTSGEDEVVHGGASSSEDNPFFDIHSEKVLDSNPLDASIDGYAEESKEKKENSLASQKNTLFFDESSLEEESLLENEKSLSNRDLFDGIFKDKVKGEEQQVVHFSDNENKENRKNLSVEGEVSLKNEANINSKQLIERSSISTSPFFQDDVSGLEENPLFLNKLNLIENENQDKKVTSVDTSKSKHYNVKIVKKKEPLFKVILGVLSYAIFILLLLIGSVLLVYVLDIKIRASKGDYSSPAINAYVVLTGSMLPNIQVYDVVVTKKVEAKDLNEGDIITFASADSRFLGTIITHRIIKKNYDADTKSYTFQTRGDNNNVADSALVPQNNIYGKVILKIPKLGYLQEFLATDGGWIIVILIPCLTVISYDVVKLVKGLKKKKYKNIKVQK